MFIKKIIALILVGLFVLLNMDKNQVLALENDKIDFSVGGNIVLYQADWVEIIQYETTKDDNEGRELYRCTLNSERNRCDKNFYAVAVEGEKDYRFEIIYSYKGERKEIPMSDYFYSNIPHYVNEFRCKYQIKYYKVDNVNDNTAPELHGVRNHDVNVGQLEYDFLEGVYATDLRLGENEVQILNLENIDFEVIGEYDIVYMVEDMSGNITTKESIVRIVDNTEPDLNNDKIDLKKEILFLHGMQYQFKELGFTLIDGYEGDLTNCIYFMKENVEVKNFSELELGLNFIDVIGKDSSGNTTSIRIVVRVLSSVDELLIIDKSTLNIEIFNEIPENIITEKFTLRENSLITFDFEYDFSNIDYSIVGLNNIQVTLTSNFDFQYIFNFEMKVEDNQSPYFDRKPFYKIELDQEFNLDNLLQINDNSKKFFTSFDCSDINLKKIGNYYLEIIIGDYNGNIIYETIEIKVVDQEEPIIKGPDEISFYLNEIINEYTILNHFVISDNESLNIEIYFNDLDQNKDGTYFVTIEASDNSGNISRKQVKVNVILVKSNLIGEKEIFLEIGEQYNELGIIYKHKNKLITDDDILIKGTVVADVIGIYEVKYYYVHNGKEMLLQTRKISVRDTIAPTIIKSDVNIEKNELTKTALIEKIGIKDNHNVDEILFSKNINELNIGVNEFEVTLVDENGNVSTHMITVNVEGVNSIYLNIFVGFIFTALCSTCFVIYYKKVK